MSGPDFRADGAGRFDRSALIRPIHALTSVLNAVGSIAIFALMCLICADVVMRYFFNRPILGVTEIVEMSIVAIVFLQLADATRRDRLTRADTFLGYLKARKPAGLRVIDFVAALFGITLMAILAYATIPAMLTEYQRGYYVGTPGLFTFPSWPLKLVIAIGVTITAIQLVLMAARAVLGDAGPQKKD